MKKYALITMTMFTMVFMQGCSSLTDESKNAPESTCYNICLILDGTDRLCEQAGVPMVTVDEMKEFAKKISEGQGTLYVGYVDDNCDNNQIVLFDWNLTKPSAPGEKKGYVMMSKHEEEKSKYSLDSSKYEDGLNTAINKFSNECATLSELAYSDFVAKQKKGSDVNGAINQAVRLLQASSRGSERSYIILVSDGCDNVGRELKDLPPNMELLIVNTNVSRHQYNGIVSREFATLGQASNFIFDKQ